MASALWVSVSGSRPKYVNGLRDEMAWFVRRSDVVKILSTPWLDAASPTERCLLRDLAVLVAEYLPRILILLHVEVIQFTHIVGSAHVLTISDDGTALSVDTESRIMDSVVEGGWAAPSLYRSQLVIDGRSGLGVFCDCYDTMTVDSLNWTWVRAEVGVPAQPSPQPFPRPYVGHGCVQNTLTVLNDSAWLIGSFPHQPSSTTTAAWRYDFGLRRWDSKPIWIRRLPGLNRHSCVALSQQHLLLTGGYIGNSLKPSNQCHLLYEVQVDGVRTLKHDQTMPSMNEARANASMVVLPKACVVVAAEVCCEVSHGATYKMMSTEYLSLRPLRQQRLSATNSVTPHSHTRTESSNWGWKRHVNLPTFVSSYDTEVLFGIDDTLIAVTCDRNSRQWNRLRVCGNCAANHCGTPLEEHDRVFRCWEKLESLPNTINNDKFCMIQPDALDCI
jgi:hypothetical protein